MHLTEDREVNLRGKENAIINKLIEEFTFKLAEKNQSADYYSTKRNTTFGKALADIYLGKKAEFLVLKLLTEEFYFPHVEVDLEIRDKNNKNWDADLPFNSVNKNYPNVHVKCCNKNTYKFCNDFSWTFQNKNNKGSGGKDSLFEETKKDLVALVYLEDKLSPDGIIKAILPFSEVKKKLKDPLKDTLKDIKKCIYYEDLLNG